MVKKSNPPSSLLHRLSNRKGQTRSMKSYLGPTTRALNYYLRKGLFQKLAFYASV